MNTPTIDGATFFAEERLRWTEREFQTEVIARACENDWGFQYHTFDSRRSSRGFPDLVLCRPLTHQVLFVELKTMRGRLSPAQIGWIEALSAAEGDGTVRVCVWRPCCWNSGEIDDVLR